MKVRDGKEGKEEKKILKRLKKPRKGSEIQTDSPCSSRWGGFDVSELGDSVA